MFENRIIPTLTISGNDLVRTTKFSSPRYVGDPLNVVRIFNNKEVDELIILDIDKPLGSEINYNLLESLAEECNMPLTYGGGIENLTQVNKIFKLGFEKILVRRQLARNQFFASEITSKYGKQSLITAIDICDLNGLTVREFAANLEEKILTAVQQGTGEVFINDRNRDGTLMGARHEIISLIARSSPVPVIWAGGFNSIEDIQLGFENGLSAVGIGSLFCYYGKFNSVLITYPSKK